MKKKETFLILFAFMLSGALGFTTYLYTHPKNTAHENQPTAIQRVHYPVFFVHQLKNDPDAGRKIFNSFCSACHAEKPAIDINAPRINHEIDWKQRKKLGIDLLLQITLQGLNAMPARGGCFECSDEQLRETIRYMLNSSQKKER